MAAPAAGKGGARGFGTGMGRVRAQRAGDGDGQELRQTCGKVNGREVVGAGEVRWWVVVRWWPPH